MEVSVQPFIVSPLETAFHSTTFTKLFQVTRLAGRGALSASLHEVVGGEPTNKQTKMPTPVSN